MNIYCGNEFSRPTLFQRRPNATSGVLALCSFIGGALIVGGVLREAAVVQMAPPMAVPAPETIATTPTIAATPPMAVDPTTTEQAASPTLQAEKALALRYFNASDVQPSGQTVEFGAFVEHDVLQAKSSGVKQIAVRSAGGIVLVVQNPDPDVVVLTGKRVVARNTSRAREYAQQLSYTMKRDGDNVVVRLAKPQQQPKDVYTADPIAIVVAPPDVRVVTMSGAPKDKNEE